MFGPLSYCNKDIEQGPYLKEAQPVVEVKVLWFPTERYQRQRVFGYSKNLE